MEAVLDGWLGRRICVRRGRKADSGLYRRSMIDHGVESES